MIRYAAIQLTAASLAVASACTDGDSAAHGSGTRSTLDPTLSAGGAAPVAGREVLLVGNSVSGTVSVIDSERLQNVGSVDVVPDRKEILASIEGDPVRALAYTFVKEAQRIEHFEPSNGERFVDDIFASPDGRTLYVSRSNLGDVAAFDLTRAGFPMLWRTPVDGLRADHATISPDGRRIVVSVHGAGSFASVLDAASGAIVGSFATGTTPHQNDYTPDGKYIYNSSIGIASSSLVPYAANALKGDRWLVKVDAQTLKVERTWVFDYGIRPNVITADQTTLYTQLSFLNGVIKYDLNAAREVARSDQPLAKFALETYANYDEYPHDSAHHGLAISGDERRLCDCGTIDNTVTILSAADLRVEAVVEAGRIPYWATTSHDGRVCFVSLSGDAAVVAIEYASGRILANVPVGNFPQRSRRARLPLEVLSLLQQSGPGKSAERSGPLDR